MFILTVLIGGNMAATSPRAPTSIDHVTVEQSADSAQVLGYAAERRVPAHRRRWNHRFA
jgi:hypothetical protein